MVPKIGRAGLRTLTRLGTAVAARTCGLNESALEALKDPAVRAAVDPAVLVQLAPVLATLR